VSFTPRRSSIDGIEKTTFDLIILCCDEPSGRKSFLFTAWTFKKEFYVVSSESVISLSFVRQGPELDSDVLVDTDKLKWPSTSEGAFFLGNHNLFIYLAPSDTLCHKVTLICLVLTLFWSIVFYCCLNSAFVLDTNIIMIDQTIQFCLCSRLLFFFNK
jgi:hypothetical protein